MNEVDDTRQQISFDTEGHALDLAALIAQLHLRNETLASQCNGLLFSLQQHENAGHLSDGAVPAPADMAEQILKLENILRQRQEELDQTYRALTQSLSREEAARRLLDQSRADVEQLVTALAQTRNKLAQSEKWVFDLAGIRHYLEKDVDRLTKCLHQETRLRERAQAKLTASFPATDAPLSEKRDFPLALDAKWKSDDTERLQALAEEIRACSGWAVIKGDLAGQVESGMPTPELPSAPNVPALVDKEQEDALKSLLAENATLRAQLDASEKVQRIINERLGQEVEKYRMEADRAAHLHLIGKAMSGVRPWWWGFMPRGWQARAMYGRLMRQGAFDAKAYLEANSDVAAAKLDPLHHYLRHGLDEGRPLAPSGD